MALNKKNEWTYHTSHSYTHSEEGENVSALTQLYQTGVYMIVNNNPAMQMALSPEDMVKIERMLKKDEKKGLITNLTFGREITVIEDEDGLYIEKPQKLYL